MMPTVLIIEDAVEMRDLISHMLRRAGYEVEEAGDGLEGLKLAQAIRPEVIILDLMMPLAAGDVTLGFLRSTEGLKHIPVIITSAHPRAASIAEKLGAQAVLLKPFDSRTLVELVGRFAPLG